MLLALLLNWLLLDFTKCIQKWAYADEVQQPTKADLAQTPHNMLPK